jgi:putative OPT family oligopeptide transporter
MNAAITYSGLKIGFTIGGSAIAAVLGWGVLRGILRKGTILENNIAQTVASSVNTSNSGVIFTLPVLFLLGIQLDLVWAIAATTAGAILGVAFIIPTRKQMIEFERLRFPTGTAVAAVLKSPGAGIQKARVLILGILASMLVFFFTQAHILGLPTYADLGIPGLSNDVFNLGAALAAWGIPWPETFSLSLAIAPFALGAGFITGRPGLVVLAGGLLAYFIVSPFAYDWNWLPIGTDPGSAASVARGLMNRPIGIGLLMGGALVGLLKAAPAMTSVVRSMRRPLAAGEERDELPIKVLGIAIVLAFLVLFTAANATISNGSVGQAALIAAVGTAWMWFAGIVIAQCTGMTDWSPISGMALLTVMICLLLTDNQVVPAVLIGAAVCVAITECADMMQDLKTGHLVGASPRKQQTLQILAAVIGPAVCILVVTLLAARNVQEFGVPFGAGTDTPAPQAEALKGVIDGIRGGDAPVPLFAMGGIMGALLSFSGIAGLGVLVGLSMYLPLMYLLPYGIGCLIQMWLSRKKGNAWTENMGVPFAAGLIVGEGLLGILFAGIQVIGG